MKKLILSAVMLAACTVAFAQVSVEGVDINALDIKYCELRGYNTSTLSQKVSIVIDYGQEFKAFKPQVIRGEDGKPVVFNTMVDALNFMEKNGWEYLNSHAVAGAGVYNYLLRRKEEGSRIGEYQKLKD
ncbi:MAG: hypothetical protein KDD28_15255 [Phaeodactylibacter sp.]|nr:hypothetical protein [Phaeodactylibacter sp.]